MNSPEKNKLDIQDWAEARILISLGLAEDLGVDGDLTTKAMISPQQSGEVRIVSRKPGIICGLPLLPEIFLQMESNVKFEMLVEDGSKLAAGQCVGILRGAVKDLLTGERTCLNFLTHLSGIATLTNKYVEAVQGTSAMILDTRKTHPGYRRLEKYAVRSGGGKNHRMGLYDAIMIKDNHREAWHMDLKNRSLSEAVLHIRGEYHGVMLIVEVDTLEQFREVLNVSPNVILLDNMPVELMREAVVIRDCMQSSVQLEASGGVTLETVRKIAETGVERISIGALTHSAPALDIGFDWGIR